MYGGGYDTSANQFAGGGFMPSQAADDHGATQGIKSRKTEQQSLRPVTVKQLVDQVKGADDDQLAIDGVPLSNITLVGKIVALADKSTQLTVKLDDGTGVLDVIKWKNEADEAYGAEVGKPGLAVGAYVRCYGTIRTFNSAKNMQAYAIRPITSFNEVTYHMLQVIYVHKHLTGKLAAAAAAPAMGGGYGAPAHKQDTAGYDQTATNGLSNLDRAIIEALRGAAGNPNGMSVDAIHAALNARGLRFTKEQVITQAHSLMNEGHCYTTSDDYHFQACS